MKQLLVMLSVLFLGILLYAAVWFLTGSGFWAAAVGGGGAAVACGYALRWVRAYNRKDRHHS